MSSALACAGAPVSGEGPAGTAPDQSGPNGLSLPWGASTCFPRGVRSEGDIDGDGMNDECEVGLARAFAPALQISPAACNATADGLDGGYVFVVYPKADRTGALIGYAPAYIRDCGWSGLKCWVRLRGGCDGHWGDSEFIGISVAFNGSVARWTTEAVFLSAHCFGRSDSDCRWYQVRDLGMFTWEGEERGAPRVWIAEGKNANYPTAAACDRGHWWFDTCERNDRSIRFPVVAHRNLGDPLDPSPGLRAFGPGLCVAFSELHAAVPRGVDADARECLARDVPFRGWVTPDSDLEGGEAGATPYIRYFELLREGPNRGSAADPA